MTVTAQSIISRVRTQLIDVGATQHWSDAELLQWLSDGLRTLVGANPAASATRFELAMVAGTKQTLPADGHLLLDVERNTTGRAVRKADQAALDAFSPEWHTSTQAAAVKHYIYNPLMQQQFYVYPPNDGTGSLQIIYSVMPADLTAVSDVLPVDDIYQTALFDYVMYRCHQKDSDYAAGGVANAYFTAFQAVATGTVAGEAAQQPNSSGAS